MKIILRTKQLKAALVALALLGLSTASRAVVLAPGQTATALELALGPQTSIGVTGAVVASTAGTFNTFNVTGTYTELVVQTNAFSAVTPTYDFLYKITVNGYTGLDAAGIVNITAGSFTGYTTDVFALSSLPSVTGVPNGAPGTPGDVYATSTPLPPVSANNDGGTIEFSYFPGAVMDSADVSSDSADATTFYLGIQTNSPSYALNPIFGFSVQDDSAVTLPGYMPNGGNPVPEPSAALFGVALLGMVGIAKSRRGSNPVIALAA